MKIDHKESFTDFGNQFFVDNQIDGYWGSEELTKDTFHPFDLKLINNKVIMEVGVGCGRVSNNLLKYKPKKLFGIEPSKAIEVAKKNINSDKMDFLNIKGQDITFKNKFDFVFSLGVIHHIPEYKEVLIKINQSLSENGKFIIWVYGKEGNGLYLFIFNNLRRITTVLPDFILRIISNLLSVLTYPYGFISKYLKLPLSEYFVGLFNKLSFKHRSYVIFDQLNPSYAKYFTREELENDLNEAGFKIDEISNRLGYSYTAICSK